jgi:hypothetical protein
MALDLDSGFSLGRAHRADASSADLLSYRTIAAIALLAHVTVLWLVGEIYDGGLIWAQTAAAISASITIYGVKQMLFCWKRGPWRWYLGLLPFLGSCWLGILGSVLLAAWLAREGMDWFAAGSCGAFLGLWWNQGAVDRHGWSTR